MNNILFGRVDCCIKMYIWQVYWKGKDAYTFYNIRVQLNPANRTKSFEAKIIRYFFYSFLTIFFLL